MCQVVTLGSTGRHMCEGEYESLKEIYSVSPDFVPRPYAWGKYCQPGPETYFLLAEFRDVGEQVGWVLFFGLARKDRTTKANGSACGCLDAKDKIWATDSVFSSVTATFTEISTLAC